MSLTDKSFILILGLDHRCYQSHCSSCSFLAKYCSKYI